MSAKGRSAGGAFGLNRQYVTCPEIYQRETENIFSRSWICVGHVSSFRETGLKPIQIEDHKLFLTLEGERVRTFRNFCRHRGSQLVSEENCGSIGQRIQCPYHAWTYERDGALVAAPNMEGVEEFDSGKFGLIEVPCETVGGFVWICMEPTQSASEFLRPIDQQFADWTTEHLQVAVTLTYEVAANWKLIFQNYSECYHCPNVHPLLNRLTPYKGSMNDVDSGPILGGPMQLSHDSESMSIDAKLVGTPLPNLSDEQLRCVNYFTIFPSMFLSTHPDYVLVHRIQRMDIDCTKIICEFLFHPDCIESDQFDLAKAVEFWDLTNRQDWEVCELAQSGMEDREYIPGPYSDLESVVAAFDKHYFEQMSNGE